MKILEERRQKVMKYLGSEMLCDIIFNYDNHSKQFLSDDKKIVKYIYNAMILITLIVYKKFIAFKKNLDFAEKIYRQKTIRTFSNSMVRLYNLLDGLYNDKRFNFDFVENVLLDLQIDANVESNEKGFIKILNIESYFKFNREDNQLSKDIFTIRKSRISSRYDSKYTIDDFCHFLMMFPILTYASVEKNNWTNQSKVEASSFSIIFNDEKVDLDDFLVSVNDEIYYLDSFNVNDPKHFENHANGLAIKNQFIEAMYLNTASESELKVVYSDSNNMCEHNESILVCHDVVVENFLLKYFPLKKDSNGTVSFFKDYIFFNNRYIRYFATVLADRLSYDGKQTVLKRYKDCYKDAFNKFRFDSDSNIMLWRWDEIMIFLLIEVGVYDFLKFLLKNTNLDYEEIISGFRLRFGERVDMIFDSDDLIRNPLLNLRYKTDENKYSHYARALIAFVSKLLSNSKVKFSLATSFVSINELQEDLLEVQSSLKMSNRDKILYFVNRVININCFIVSFYYGLFEYISYQRINELEKLENIIIDKNLVETERLQQQCLNVFMIESKRVRRSNNKKFSKFILPFKDDALFYDKMIEGIVDSFELIYELNRNSGKRNTKMNEQLFEVLGRYRFVDDDIIRDMQTKIMDEINRLSKYSNANNVDTKKLFDVIVLYLGYLRDSALEKSNNIENSIYPIIGSCMSSVLSRDGYRYSYVSVNHGENGARLRVKIITEDDLNPGELYYIVPNAKRCALIEKGTVAKSEFDGDSSERIWVSPIVIPISAFMPDVVGKVEKLDSKEDYRDAARLLYMTDPKIYKNLFGSIDVAEKVLTKLFDNAENCIFFKEYVYVMKAELDGDENKVIGIATLYNGFPNLDVDIIRDAFQEVGEAMPDSIDLALKYLEDTFKDATGDNYVICDLCIHPEKRGMGFGKLFLNELTKTVERFGMKDIVLTVYCDNYQAINLYSSNGFIAYANNHDNRGDESLEEYIKMIRYS